MKVGGHQASSASLATIMTALYMAALLPGLLVTGLFVLVILGIVCRLCGFSVLKLIRYLKAELLLVLGTSSSESALHTARKASRSEATTAAPAAMASTSTMPKLSPPVFGAT